MKYIATAAVFLLFVACSSTCTLKMDSDTDLSTLPNKGQCWLCEFEDICISLADNKDFDDSEALQNDISRGIRLLKELDKDDAESWYSTLTEDQRDRIKSVTLQIAIHYGVKHFLQ